MNANGQPMNILLIDDDRDTQTMIGTVLEHYHHHLAVVESAEAALTYLADHPAPDLILLDIYLPGMDGYQAIHRLRALTSTSKIIAITAFFTASTEKDTQNWGFDAYLPKPISTTYLVPNLEAILHSQRAKYNRE